MIARNYPGNLCHRRAHVCPFPARDSHGRTCELLSLECSGEQLVGLYVLVEYPMPCGIRAPGTIEGVLGLQADQVGRVIGTILGGHQLLDCIGVPTGILQPFL